MVDPSPSAAAGPSVNSNPKSKKKGKKQAKAASSNNAAAPASTPETSAPTTAPPPQDSKEATNGEVTPAATPTMSSPNAHSPTKTNGNIGDDVRLSLFAELEKDRKALEEERRKTAELEKRIEELSLSAAAAAPKDAGDAKGDDAGRVAKLEAEIADLRAALDTEQSAREDERKKAEEERAEIEGERDRVQDQYNNLLERVTTIRNTLGERIKADAEELATTKSRLEELEEQNSGLNDNLEALAADLATERAAHEDTRQEAGSLRSRLNLSQQNWNREREELVKKESECREELDATRQAMQEWEIIATEERSIRESLSERVVELEEALGVTRSGYEEVVRERDGMADTIAGLQRALKELQESHQKDRRELVETTSSQIKALTDERSTLTSRLADLEKSLKESQEALETAATFESQVREKNLLIGKLRHEAVTLNDHLRKALRMLRKDNADDKIDKNLVTNLFLQFVSIQRGDTKKYEVLQLIASVLGWDDSQREKAGLLRPGRAEQNPVVEERRGFWGGGGLLTPQSAGFRRSPSTPTLGEVRSPSTPGLGDAYDGSKELWTSVLDSEKN